MSESIVTIAALIARIGEETGVSRWVRIDQTRIDAFADVTEDHQFIHVDTVKARETPFGGTVAHGFLTLSMLSALAYDALPRVANVAMGVNYGFDKVRFIMPTPAGARIRGRFRLAEMTERGAGEFLMRNQATVEIEGAARPALVADWLTLYVMATQAEARA
jgi:acyl dehydratase